MTTEENHINGKDNRPIETLRHGAVSMGIWAEVTEKGTYYQPGRLTRSYLDKSGSWKTTFYLRNEDMLDAALLCQDVYRRIEELRRAQRQAEKQEQQEATQPNI
jgi:hypothetical protein